MKEALKSVVFYNYANLGDVFCSRGVIDWVVNNVEAQSYKFSHLWSPYVTQDIDNVGFISQKDLPYMVNILKNSKGVPRNKNWEIEDGVLYANVSYMAGSCYFEKETYALILLEALKMELKRLLGINVNAEVKDIVPFINFSRFDMSSVDKYIESAGGKKKVLVCNNNTCSGQAVNFNMDPLIERFSKDKPNVLFFVSNCLDKKIQRENVKYVDEIVPVVPCDLPEISYISTKCDYIFSRGSGPGTYSIVRENMTNGVKFIAFGSSVGASSFGLEKIYENKFYHKSCRVVEDAISFSNSFIQSL